MESRYSGLTEAQIKAHYKKKYGYDLVLEPNMPWQLAYLGKKFVSEIGRVIPFKPREISPFEEATSNVTRDAEGNIISVTPKPPSAEQLERQERQRKLEEMKKAAARPKEGGVRVATGLYRPVKEGEPRNEGRFWKDKSGVDTYWTELTPEEGISYYEGQEQLGITQPIIARFYKDLYGVAPQDVKEATQDFVNALKFTPQFFFEDLLEKKTPTQSVAEFLKAMGASDEDIREFIPAYEEALNQDSTPESLIETIFPDMTSEEIIKMAKEEPELFIDALVTKGRTRDVELLLTQGGATTEEIDELFGVEVEEEFPRTANISQFTSDYYKEREWRPIHRALASPEEIAEDNRRINEAREAYQALTGKSLFDIGKENAALALERATDTARAILPLPRQVAVSVLQAVQGQGGASVVNKDWADKFIATADEDYNKFVGEIAKKYGDESGILIKMSDIAGVSKNIAYSLTSMGVGLAVGGATAAIPLPGARAAAWFTGSAASGAVAYSMTTYQIMQQYLEFKDAEKRAESGKGLTLEEENQLKKDFESKARAYGLWEAVPEAISNLGFAKILTAPLTRVVGKVLAGQILLKIAGMYGEELLTETITQKGQSKIEVEAGLRDGNIGWVDAFHEVAPQTFLLTTILGGAGQVGVSAVSKIKQSLVKEVGANHPLVKTFGENITDVLKGSVVVSERGMVGGRKGNQLGQSIAKELGVRFDGVQKGVEGIPSKMQFTDPQTGSTTYGNTLEEVRTNLENMRARFKPLVAKEPWMMTREEYRAQSLSRATELIVPRATKTGWGKPLPLRKSEIQRLSTTGSDEAHEHWVRVALKEGKPVPAEVLKDYPDLQKQGKLKPSKNPYSKVPIGVTRKDASRGIELAQEYLAEIGDKPSPEAVTPEVAKKTPYTLEETTTVKNNKSVQGWEVLANGERISPAPEIYTDQARAQARIEKLNQAYADIMGEIQPLIPKAQEGMPEAGEVEVTMAEPPTAEAVTPVKPPPPERPVDIGTLPPPPPNTPPIVPTKSGENVIGLRTIKPGLVRSQIIGNIAKRLIGKVGIQTVEADPMANAAMTERARVKVAIESNANVLGTKAEDTLKVFTFDKDGRIQALAGIDPSIDGAPTIQDVAARLPRYRSSLSEAQLNALAELRKSVEPYRKLLEEVGVEVPSRPDVMESGFYLPRGRASLEGTEEPFKVGGRLRGTKKGFERPAFFNSMAEGINKGYEYSKTGETLTAYAYDAGMRAANAHVVNYFKALTDETGQLLGETPKMRMLRQSPEIANTYNAIKDNLDKLKRNIGALTNRQLEIIELWQNDPDFTDIDILLDGLETMRGGAPAMTMPELKALYEENMDALKTFRPEYKVALRRAQATPRDQGVINLPGLQGRTFPNEIANAANIILSKEGRTVGALAPVVNVANAFNNLYRGIRATLDNSALGIQGLLGMYGDPKAYAEALKVNVQAWGIGGDKILGAFLTDYDAQATQSGRLTSDDWARAGLHLGGATSEFQLGGVGSAISNLPVVRQANRAFGFFGDALRLQWADNELSNQLAKRSLNEIRESGDLDRIANGANVMTGWTTGKAFGSLGDLVTFAPRFLQARLETIAKAVAGMRPNATLDQRIARNSVLKMITFGTLLTVIGNMIAGEDDTDFRPIVDGRRNPKFMRIKFKGHYYSVFGTWDSLLGIFINVGTGKPLLALRSMASGSVTVIWDLITGRDYNYKAVMDTPAHFAGWVLNSFVPFSVGQIPVGVKQFAGGVIDGDINEVVGGGVNVITTLVGVKSYPEEDWETNRGRLGLNLYDDPNLYSTENPIYDFKMYSSDVLSKLGKYNPKEIIGNRDYPLDVQTIVRAKELYKQVMELDGYRLISLNADSASGDTYVQLRKQWLEYEKVKDDSGKLKEFLADKRNSEYKKGDMSQTEYALLVQYHGITDKKRKQEFLEAYPELTLIPREEYLKSHPDDNALLALSGDADVMTQKAYDRALALMDELDIPASAVKDFLPPKEVAKDFFSYNDAVSRWSAGSSEAKLIRVKNPTLDTFLNKTRTDPLVKIDTPIKSLEIKVKNRNLSDEYDGYSDEKSPFYIPGEKERKKARADFKLKNPTYFDDLQRIEAYEHDGDQFVDKWVEHGKLSSESEGYNVEEKLWLFDNPDVHKWALAQGLITDTGKDWNIPSMRITAKYRTEDAEYDALPTTGTARADYLKGNDTYRMDRRRRDAYQKDFPTNQVENYVQYYELEGRGYRQERMLAENPDFAKYMHDIAGIDLPDPKKIPMPRYDDLYDQFSEQFQRLEGLSNNESPYYIENPTIRQRTADNMRRDTQGRLTPFGKAIVEREGLKKLIGNEKYVKEYVQYYSLPEKGTAREDYLMTHRDFYKAVWLGILHNQPVNLISAPSGRLRRLAEQGLLEEYRKKFALSR